MRIPLSAIPLCLCAAPVFAECYEDDAYLFACQFPEHNGGVTICSPPGSDTLNYVYWADNRVELDFTATAWGGLKRHVKGINGTAMATALSNGGTVYAIFVEEALNFEGRSSDLFHSPNPAVLQVYATEADYLDFETDRPIARRVCDPLSIEIDHTRFGPG